MTPFPPAARPTLHFIGVTTGRSAILRIFPAWAAALGLDEAVVRGIDLPPGAAPEAYRAAVAFIRDDPLSRGALVTTHKIDLYRACCDLFDEEDRFAALMGEAGCLSKRDGRLVCGAMDPISSGLAMDGFLPPGHFARTGAEVFSIGAGGAAIALTCHLMAPERRADTPSRIVVADRSRARLDGIARIHAGIAAAAGSAVPVDYVLTTDARMNDVVLGRLPPGSLVVNATGLGKDAPGSPVTDDALFPEAGIAWDLNYRGDLVFLDQARRQRDARRLRIEDGWSYFLHGWTLAIAEVFGVPIPQAGPRFQALSELAAQAAPAASP